MGYKKICSSPNAVQSPCPLLKERNTESAQGTSLEGLRINEKNRIKMGYNRYRLETDWEKKSAKADVKWFAVGAIKQRSKHEEYDFNSRIKKKKEVEVTMDRCKNEIIS